MRLLARGNILEAMIPDDDDVLVCEFAQRPRGAPSIFDVAPAIRQVTAERESLIVEFDPATAGTVQAYVAAERLCCPTIGWEIEEEAALRLRISATPGRLQTLQEMFATARSSV